MRVCEFDYDLPPELIAQGPLPHRSDSRLMLVHRDDGRVEHRRFRELPALLHAGDVLVVNDTRVIPARLFGRRMDTGGRVEILLVEDLGGDVWEAMYRASGRAQAGRRLRLCDDRMEGEIREVTPDGRVRLRLVAGGPVREVLEQHGFAPVPPYVRRGSRPSAASACDRERYQTVYARSPGAIAAPTAGLHFTTDILDDLARQGVERVAVTLHVGPGTFLPVRTDLVEDHTLESERFGIGDEAAAVIERALSERRRVVAVGSTSVRVLETVIREHGRVCPAAGRTSLFIHPPFEFRCVGALITNFHLPRSTLIMMVAAFAGTERTLHAYAEAVRERYRFFSYGDCMLVV